MKARRLLVLGVVLATAVALYAGIVIQTRTFRTVALVGAVFQNVDPLSTNTPVYGFLSLAGHDFVNLALGTPVTTLRTNEVLALEIDCASSGANLVIHDKTLDSNIVTLATSTRFDRVFQQDNPATTAPNRERFVAQMDINPNGFLVAGNLTIAGRIYLDPDTGCPHAVLVDIDKVQDKLFSDKKVKDTEKDVRIAGFGHVIGVADVIFQDGSTNAVLIPFGRINMRRQLLP